MVGNRDEVESATGGRIRSEVDRARYHLSRLTRTFAIALRGVHMQIAAIPCRPCLERHIQFRWFARYGTGG